MLRWTETPQKNLMFREFHTKKKRYFSSGVMWCKLRDTSGPGCQQKATWRPVAGRIGEVPATNGGGEYKIVKERLGFFHSHDGSMGRTVYLTCIYQKKSTIRDLVGVSGYVIFSCWIGDYLFNVCKKQCCILFRHDVRNRLVAMKGQSIPL